MYIVFLWVTAILYSYELHVYCIPMSYMYIVFLWDTCILYSYELHVYCIPMSYSYIVFLWVTCILYSYELHVYWKWICCYLSYYYFLFQWSVIVFGLQFNICLYREEGRDPIRPVLISIGICCSQWFSLIGSYAFVDIGGFFNQRQFYTLF